jgi:hypothetical protein
MMLIFTGSLWGLSAAKRLGEERTWPRLGLLFLGWTFTPGGICAFIVPLIVILEKLDHRGPGESWLWWVCHLGVLILPGIVPVVAAVRVERRCRAKAMELPRTSP